MLTTQIPTDWRDLQESVARILTESGFAVEIEKVIQTVHGAVAIDVFAEETIDGRTYVVLCECKHWAARVPQNVIHGFRTVLTDSGANLGYIISMAGFQSGALTAAELTNIRLVTWIEFQTEFQESWFRKYFVPTVAELIEPLRRRKEPMSYEQFNALDETGKQSFVKLWSEYDNFDGSVFFAFSLPGNMYGPNGELILEFEHGDRHLPQLPLRTRIGQIAGCDETALPDSVLDACSYRELLDAIARHVEHGIYRFREVISRHRTATGVHGT